MPRRDAQGSGPEAGAVSLMEPGAASSPVEPRSGATISPDMVNVFEQAVSPGAAPGLHLVPLGGRPAGDAIALSVLAWVRNVAYDKEVWVDLYVLGEGGDVLHAETIPLTYQEPAEGGGDFFAAGAAVPAPMAGASGSSRRMLQFRIYGQMNGQVFTDGVLHVHGVEATPARRAAPKAPTAKTAAPVAPPTPAATPAPVAKATAPKVVTPKVAKPKAVAPKPVAPKKAVAKTTPVEKAAEPKPAAAPKARKPKKP
jgi:hypothetical protein